MNKQTYSGLLNQLIKLYVRGGRIEEIEERNWSKFLAKCDYNRAKQAIDKTYIEHGPQTTYGSLPDLKQFKQTYMAQRPTTDSKSKHPYCPCCDGGGWLSFDDGGQGIASRCPCRTGQSTSYQTVDACANLHCQNPTHASTVVYMAGFSVKYPWIVAGFGKCKYRPSVSEKKKILDSSEDVDSLVKSVASQKDFKRAAAGDVPL